MKKYKIIKKEVGSEEIHVIESNIEECELESYIRKYLQFEYFKSVNYVARTESDTLTIEDLEEYINGYIRNVKKSIVNSGTQAYLGNNLFLRSYEQNIRLFISLFDYGELAPICAKPEGEHKLIILDNGVVHSGTTEKPVGTVNYDVSVCDFDFNSFRFCCEVVINFSEYFNGLGKDTSLADMILEHFNGKAPFDIEFAEKEKQ